MGGGAGRLGATLIVGGPTRENFPALFRLWTTLHDVVSHQKDDTQLEYWQIWSCWVTSPSHPRLRLH